MLGYMTDQLPDATRVRAQLASLQFLDFAQVADELNTTESMINKLVDSGQLQATRYGKRRRWRIERAALEDYITMTYTRAREDVARHQ